jgi:AhpD family alkylhydroperoxidase
MDQDDKVKIDKIVQDRKAAHQTLVNKDSKVYKAFLELQRIAFSDGHLPKVQKELIAVGISVVMNCESCMEWHIHQALQSGANEDQILEAIEVGIEMGGGPATVFSRFALKVLEYHKSSK